MIKGLYTAAAGLLPRNLEQEVAANNIANLNTTGFKKDGVHFKKLLDSQITLAILQGIGNGETDVQEVLIDFSQGNLAATDNPLDFAIEGFGFFVVMTPDGERFSRDGHFQLNSNGELVNGDGFPVMGSSGPIVLVSGNFEVNEKGEILQNDEVIDRIRIVDFPRPYPLRKYGESLFELSRNVDPIEDPEGVEIKQGFLEESNVNPITEMVRLINISKSFQAGQRVIQDQDRTLEKTVNHIGKY